MSQAKSARAQQIEHLFLHWQRMQREWEETKGAWNDPVQRRFERHFWRQYEELMQHTRYELPRLDKLMRDAVRKCP